VTEESHTYSFMFPIADWHEWFAWYPVRTWDYRWTWLQTVRRRRLQTKPDLPGPMVALWEYERIDR
jgi:hypothetical protein